MNPSIQARPVENVKFGLKGSKGSPNRPCKIVLRAENPSKN